MIKGLGCDIVQVKRLVSWCYSKELLMRVFTTSEINQLPKNLFIEGDFCPSKNIIKRASEQLAGMFGVKEAYKKAVGTHYGNVISMKDIIIEKNSYGAPRLRLERSAAKALVACSAQCAFVSIAHEKEYAIATVIIE